MPIFVCIFLSDFDCYSEFIYLLLYTAHFSYTTASAFTVNLHKCLVLVLLLGRCCSNSFGFILAIAFFFSFYIF